ncbi:hypothetical protein BpHYR1_030268 [Brachionus plicatilis]|uniref:Uncharacterized protein n=1 Tax=Brachionus plicatilis TaxID=10195 RepID=A0A3M7SGV6_BRAPC|nr:hypothetical protein BpHYR1_030268 [Brachionus plicatilis]
MKSKLLLYLTIPKLTNRIILIVKLSTKKIKRTFRNYDIVQLPKLHQPSRFFFYKHGKLKKKKFHILQDSKQIGHSSMSSIDQKLKHPIKNSKKQIESFN